MGPLNQYLKDVSHLKFQWGKHDCLTFTNEAWRVMHGVGWADDWLGRYMVETPFGLQPMRKDQLRSEFGFFSFDEAMDARLNRVRHVPPRGALVASSTGRYMIGLGLGICVGMKCAFLSRDGVIYKPVTEIVRAWT